MAGSLGTLTLDLIAKIGGFTGPMDQAGRAAKRSSKEIADSANEASLAWSALGEVAAGVVAGFSVATIFGRFISETKGAEREQAQLGAVLRSTGESAGFNRDQLNAMADAMQRATTFSGGDISQAQTTLLAFTGVIGNQFNRALQSAADMAARTGVSVKDAAETIGRALDVPSEGLTSLSKQGFRFTEEQKKMAVAMESTGDIAGAQGIILKSLEESYGGAAAAARDTFGGSLDALQNTISGLLTGDGSLDSAKSAVSSLNEALSTPGAKAAVDALGKAAGVLAVVLAARLASAAAATAVSFAAASVEAVRYQLALARMAGVSTAAAAGLVGIGVAARAASAAMALLGGPVGIVITAAAALAYFMSTSNDAKESAGALADKVDWLNKSFDGFTKNQAKAALAGISEEYRLQGYAIDSAQTRVRQYQMNLKAFPKDDRVREWNEGLIEQSAVLDTLKQSFSALGVQMASLTSRIEAPDTTIGSKVYEEMSKKIQEQILLAGKSSEADKLAARIKAGLVEGLKAGEGDLLVASQKRADAAIKAAEATKKADDSAKASAKSAAEALAKRGVDAEENYRRQITLIDETTGKQGKATEVAKLAFELETGKLKGVSVERQKVLKDLAAELDSKVKLKKQNEQDLKLATLAANLKDSNTIVKQGFDMELAGAGSGEKLRGRLKEDLAIQQDYAKQRAEMYKQYKEAELLGDPDAKDTYDKETALLEEALAERMVIQQDHYNQQDKAQANWMDGVSDAWQNYVDAATNYTAMAADATSSILDSAKGGLSNFLSDVISGAESADNALGDLVANFAKSTLQALSDMAAQWLVYQAVQLLVGKSTQASAAPMLIANAQATASQASLAAYASTAAIPIIGPAAAPAAAASAALATAPMVAGVASAALAGMAHDGIDAVPETGTWLLQKGERVTTAETSAKLDKTLDQLRANSGGGGGGGIHISAPVSVQAQPGMSGDDARKQGEAMGQGLVSEIRRVLQGEMGQGGMLWRRV
ncbi:phage tail tape measure protein [Pseudomonas sp. BCA14]|uniref:phage tail tape measure protein n=1 Tax=unclassified Pseudomonas TaxID=196821 RepID=UPI00106F083C|nr:MULTISPECIES: phage tail tape measure protein [unclassified Pseudomonas]TFF09667.1 phage tail tape measure protein [Pseudomonas sp. JMN1]TFF11809.1 phage tail tape measure protein [Pseudomonas sp. BCA17]TFF28585.1 phage tail tape measure protein [Pseudomonas sp. BCA14]